MTASPLAFDDHGNGPAVVLIHGHPFDRSMWNPQVEPLAATFRVLAPDLRGYGKSAATPGTVTMRGLAADVERLLDELEIPSAAVVGLSMGGLVAMELVLARPERWWAVGLVATTARPITAEERAERLTTAAAIEEGGIGVAADAMLPRLLGPGCDPAVIAFVDRMMRRNNPVGAAAALRGRAERPDYRPGLRTLDLPSFVCTGTEDTWSTAEVTAELVGSLQSPRTLLLPGVAHMPNLERPADFNRELIEFLSSSRPSAYSPLM